MFRKKLASHSSKNSDIDKPALDDSFWHWYVDSYSRMGTSTIGNPIPANPKKYSSSSSAVTTIQKYFEQLKHPIPSTNQIIALLKSPFTQGEIMKTFHLIRFFQLSSKGFFLTNENHDRFQGAIKFAGAENWENVMCYLDALLFAMFANLESFEPILFISNQHENYLVNQLASLLRLYVSLLRSGNIITTDITMRICEVLMKLGFNEAMSHKQQDSASLFEFLTETLSMPLLTFKVDIKHGGKYNKDDDSKISKERILFVSIPDDDEKTEIEKSNNEHIEESQLNEDPEDGILLEECLEHYFNNSISVKRELERRATLESLRRDANPGGEITPTIPELSYEDSEEKSHFGSVDFNTEDGTSPSTTLEGTDRKSSKNSTSVNVRTRSSTISIWSLNDNESSSKPKEVSLPAWMFLRMLPFYTDDNAVLNENSGESLAKNSKEFVNRRPILPICLKRYSFDSNKSTANRSSKKIVIPPVIDLPQFVADESREDIAGNFKLILESAVCHRGNSISSGHFVSVIRKDLKNPDLLNDDGQNAIWYLYDDMKKDSRIIEKTFKDIFSTEWPYILFYRLVANDPSKTGEVISSSSSLNSGNFKAPNSKSFFISQGSNSKYWVEDSLSPILSASIVSSTSLEEDKNNISDISSTLASSTMDILPSDLNFVDIRNKYYWYVTDKDKNYYKEIQVSNDKESYVSISPQFRRNSQWSESSVNSLKQVVSEINLNVPNLSEANEVIYNTSLNSSESSILSGWRKSMKVKKSLPNSENSISNLARQKSPVGQVVSPKAHPVPDVTNEIHTSKEHGKKSKHKYNRSKSRRAQYKDEKCILM